VEGFKQDKKPKIEVFRSQIHQTPLFPEDDLLVAVVTDSPYSARVPVLQFEEIQAICDLIERYSGLELNKSGLLNSLYTP
jgi:molybdopterin-guanine dinucleotide biosynthesis protein B